MSLSNPLLTIKLKDGYAFNLVFVLNSDYDCFNLFFNRNALLLPRNLENSYL